MTLGVCSRGTDDADFGFSDDGTQEVSLEVDSTEDDLEGTRVVRVADLRMEGVLAFSEYRNYNRIHLTVERGWDQYLQKSRNRNLRSR